MSTTVNEVNMLDHFGKTDEPISHNGAVSADWLYTATLKRDLETSSREYQREKVASVSWKQNIIRTILCNPYARIPQIHIRVMNLGDDSYSFEVIDGQQRTSAIIGYLNSEFPLPDYFETSDKIDVSGMYAADMRKHAPKVYERIKQYQITCIWYENLDDDQVARLFTEVLNNVNNMKPQEIRNAIRGQLSTYIRNSARFETPHELFTKVITKAGKKKEKEELKYLPKLTLNGRMEADEWLSQLIYLNEMGPEKGLKGQKELTKWIRNMQAPGAEASMSSRKFASMRNRCDELLKFAFKIISSVNTNRRSELTPAQAMFLVLYGRSLEKGNYTVQDAKKFTDAFFYVLEKWSDLKKKVYQNHSTADGGFMPPMVQLFGGKNDNAIKTVFWILNKELTEMGADFFGLTELDPRESFTKKDILTKWKEQGYKCFYTGRMLEEDELVGDHYIPRSWGIDKGGVTEYTNLVVTDKQTNLQKLSMHGDDFIKKLNGAS